MPKSKATAANTANMEELSIVRGQKEEVLAFDTLEHKPEATNYARTGSSREPVQAPVGVVQMTSGVHHCASRVA